MASLSCSRSLWILALVVSACNGDRGTATPAGAAAQADTSVPAVEAQFVADEQVALELAESVLVAKYGRAQIETEKPLRAELRDSVWLVTGTLPSGHVGGVAQVEINQSDARVLRIDHEL
jgi:hypothetical protein